MTEIAHAVVSLMILILKHLLYSALLYSATAIKVLTTAAGQQATRTRLDRFKQTSYCEETAVVWFQKK